MAALECAKAYRNAQVYVARGGGYGEAVLSALRVAGYRNVGSELDAAKARQQRDTLGVTESAETRIKAMQAVSSMLQRGQDDIPSRDVIRCFGNCIVDRAGKIVARSGKDPMTGSPYQDEDLILTGHGNRLLDLLGPPPKWVTREKSVGEEFRERLERAGFRGVTTPKSSARQPLDVAKW
jgi:Zn-dependent alcohol dehydrogenase